jgi:regulator of protease activity HflC (stomatin/prohibitin superfamily)
MTDYVSREHREAQVAELEAEIDRLQSDNNALRVATNAEADEVARLTEALDIVTKYANSMTGNNWRLRLALMRITDLSDGSAVDLAISIAGNALWPASGA